MPLRIAKRITERLLGERLNIRFIPVASSWMRGYLHSLTQMTYYPTNNIKKNEWLQAARALASVAVMLFHMGPHLMLVPQFGTLGPWIQWGFIGVDIFFVLSGFVVYQSADRARFTWNAFLLRRIARIFLGYWPVLVFMAGVTVLSNDWPTQSVFWKSVFLLSPSLFVNWLPTAWSLTYELYFYLWISLICLLAVQMRAILIGCVMTMLVAWNLGWFYLDIFTVISGSQPLSFALPGFGIEFLAGALLAHWRNRDQRFKSRLWARWLLIVGAMFIICGLLLGSSSPIHASVEGMRAVTFGTAGLGCLLIALALADLGWAVWPSVVLIGDSSYSLYLLHPPLIVLMALTRETWGISGQALMIYSIMAPVLIIWFSIWWFHIIEQPLFNWVMTKRLTQLQSKPKLKNL